MSWKCVNEVNVDIYSSFHSIVDIHFTQLQPDLIAVFVEQREQVPFSMAIRNVELVHECFKKHLRMGTAKMK